MENPAKIALHIAEQIAERTGLEVDHESFNKVIEQLEAPACTDLVVSVIENPDEFINFLFDSEK